MNPVLFVHGIGASGKVWKRFGIPERNSYYLSFSNRFAHPKDQAAELKAEIERILKIERSEKVVLVCHSMGGLVARKYLAGHPFDHHVEKIILLSALNLGSVGLSFNFVPLLLILIGLLTAAWRWPLLLVLMALVWEVISYFRGVLLLSPAAWAMRPNSNFLKELNCQKMPTDIKYVAVLSGTKAFPHVLVNFFLFREGGDGAVPISSQRLSSKCVPNFSELSYSELRINLPHFEIPYGAEEAILQALRL